MSRQRLVFVVKSLAAGLSSGLLLVALAAYWLLHSAAGAAWLWSRAETLAAGAVKASRLSGDLASGFEIGGFEYRSDGFDLRVARARLEAGPDWWPLSVAVRKLHLEGVRVVLRSPGGQQAAPGGGNPAGSALAALRLPLALKIDDGLLTGVEVQRGEGPPQTVAEFIRFRGALGDRLVVEHLEVKAPGLEAQLQAWLALEPPFALAASARGRLEAGGIVALPFGFECSGSPGDLSFSLRSLEEGLQLGGQALELAASGALTGDRLAIDSLELAGAGVSLGLSGAADWSRQAVAQFDAVIRQLDPSPWAAAWPAGQQLAGNVQLEWSGKRLRVPAGSLTVDGTGLAIELDAEFDTQTDTVTVNLGWRHLVWPLPVDAAVFSSAEGQLAVRGAVDRWQASAQLSLRVGEYPQGRFDIRGEGGRHSARIVVPAGEMLGGTLSGAVDLDWSETLSWSASLHALGVDPEPLLPGWPGNLDLDAELGAAGQPPALRIDLASARGQLRGIPLTAAGGVLVGDGQPAFENFELSTRDARLQLDGSFDGPGGLGFRFKGALPSPLLAGARGELEVAGRYAGRPGRPLIELELEARDLVWNDLRVAELTARTGDAGPVSAIPALQASAAGLGWKTWVFDRVELALDPAGEQQLLQLGASGPLLEMAAGLTLSPPDPAGPLAGQWNAVLDALEMTVDRRYELSLSEPARLAWSADGASVERLCLRERGGANLCAGGGYRAADDWSLLAEAGSVPLDYVGEVLGLDAHFEQLLAGRLEWRQEAGQSPVGGAEFSIGAGRILDTVDNETLAETAPGRFGFALEGGDLKSGVLEVMFPGAGFIAVDFEVLDVTGGEDGRKLSGRAKAQLDDLRLLGGLAMPGIDDIDGRLLFDIQLGGSLADPELLGDIRLANGMLGYTPIGLKLEDIEFVANLEQRDRGRLSGRFRAGEGAASVEGEFAFEDLGDVRMDLAFSGENLFLVNTDALKFRADADLRLGLGPQRVEIDGLIRVPSARLTPSNLLVGKVYDSEDLRVEGPDGVASALPAGPGKGPAVHGQLEIAFGDDVVVKVPGVETSVGGSVLYRWSGDRVPLAEGAYELHGKVDVYGPTLRIDKGYISFPGLPADNPILNIRAQREIFGNTQIRSAGVQVIGTLKRPVFEAYTVPVTNEDRAWTLLVTGTDFDQGQGVEGFDVGTYLAPRLYVSYGVSLFDNEKVISARYDLKKGFGVKVTSGQRETGLDASYTVDR